MIQNKELNVPCKSSEGCQVYPVYIYIRMSLFKKLDYNLHLSSLKQVQLKISVMY